MKIEFAQFIDCPDIYVPLGYRLIIHYTLPDLGPARYTTLAKRSKQAHLKDILKRHALINGAMQYNLCTNYRITICP